MLPAAERAALSRRQMLRAGVAALAPLLPLPSRACEFFAPNLRIVHPWTRQSADAATTAVVCMVIDQVSADDRLVGAWTPLAQAAAIGGLQARPVVDLAIAQGRETLLSEAGTYLLLTGLTDGLEVGRVYPLMLRFERGGQVATDLSVDYARFL